MHGRSCESRRFSTNDTRSIINFLCTVEMYGKSMNFCLLGLLSIGEDADEEDDKDDAVIRGLAEGGRKEEIRQREEEDDESEGRGKLSNWLKTAAMVQSSNLLLLVFFFFFLDGNHGNVGGKTFPNNKTTNLNWPNQECVKIKQVKIKFTVSKIIISLTQQNIYIKK